MNRIVIALCAVFVAFPVCAEEWTELFNGRDLEGWTAKGGEASYEVVDGMLVGTTKPNTPNTFLCPDRSYADFELRFEVKCDPQLNSGIQIRSADKPKMIPDALGPVVREKARRRVRSGSLCGPQVEIAANGNAGGLWFEGVGGWTLKPKPELANEVYQKDGWNEYRILADGRRVAVWINGTKISDGPDDRSGMSSGYLGFQVHGVGARKDPLRVRWRNIRIRTLDD
ncbi:3-keto-disaccharide hydrolase [Kiritimatiella glycovorans]|uniref:3-keto-alpha-glucoside-1,2-lyase/3-keto-2-hydroxy-glucal hydratase domain-containing protein n=1 Tax=Kiritimatiella glycovorans TaxID=1307763 RepID=A0A0G3EDQ7_9BACT|nr:DUF1080 domain-containing protein [Kiritimatiella glycovorans]AKJ63537.1 hypothetical protein L21SP4_00254 [Kiritimatiella glycovorans]